MSESDGYSDPERVKELFCMWNDRLLIASIAHYSAANKCEWYEKALSIFNISMAISVLFLSTNTAFVGATITKLGMAEENGPWLVSIFSVLVVLSSAAQYILQLGSRASSHKLAGNEFSNLRRKIERYWSKGKIHSEAVHSLNRAYNMISKTPPLVGKKTWNEARDQADKEAESIKKNYYRKDDTADLDST